MASAWPASARSGRRRTWPTSSTASHRGLLVIGPHEALPTAAPPGWTWGRYTPGVRPRRVLPLVLAAVTLGGVAAALVTLGDSSGPGSHVTPGASARSKASEAASDVDHSIALEPRLVGREGPSAPSAAATPAAVAPSGNRTSLRDPWLPGEAGCQGGSEAPEPKRYGPHPAARVSSAGDLVFDKAEWTARPSADGFELASYDLGAFAPAVGAFEPALHSAADGARATAAPARWWTGLVEALVEAVGRDRWPRPETLLAWDPARAMLYVRQDAQGHAHVAGVLAQRAAGRLGTVSLIVEAEAPQTEAAAALTVDVPWGTVVRAHRGTAWAYFGDYDVEVGQGFFRALPIMRTVDTGFGVSARRVEAVDGVGLLDVVIAASSGRPGFEPYSTSITKSYVEVTIEIARLEVARWRGRIPAVPGRHRVQLDDGRAVTLVVQEERPGPRLEQPFRRHVLPPPPEAKEPPAPRGPARLVVTWSAPGPLQGTTREIPLVVRGAFRDGLVYEGACTVNLRGETVDTLARECPWPLPEGGVKIRASVLAAGDVDVLDLVVERSDAALEERPSAPCLRQDWSGGKYRSWTESLSLPVCPVRVDTRRVHVPVGSEAVVRLDDGPGGVLRVSLPRND